MSVVWKVVAAVAAALAVGAFVVLEAMGGSGGHPDVGDPVVITPTGASSTPPREHGTAKPNGDNRPTDTARDPQDDDDDDDDVDDVYPDIGDVDDDDDDGREVPGRDDGDDDDGSGDDDGGDDDD